MKAFLLTVIFFFLPGASIAMEYSVGQVWSYKTRSGEESSTILINKIESHPKLGNIFHISVRNVSVSNPNSPSGVTTDLPHFPVSELTLSKSCIKVTGQTDPNPEYLEGYGIWREAFDAGEAGVFDLSVAEIVSFIEQTLTK